MRSYGGKMVRIHEIKLRAGESESRLPGKAERRLGLPKGSIRGVRIVKESLDAREKLKDAWGFPKEA